MNCCSVGTGSPLQPPTAITDVPEAISRAAADCEPFVAADHRVCVAASRPASSELVASSFIQTPDTFDDRMAVGIVPWCGRAAVATETAAVPASPATHPATSATTGGRGHNTAQALTTANPATSHGSHTGPKALRCNKSAEGPAASTIIDASAHRPSQLDLRRHAQTAPMPTRPATAGAMATV